MPTAPQCSAAFVAGQLAYWRATPRFGSLLAMVPCDAWQPLRNRTLWVIGDSQAQCFYRALAWFLRPFHAPARFAAQPPAPHWGAWGVSSQWFCTDPPCAQVGGWPRSKGARRPAEPPGVTQATGRSSPAWGI